MGWLGVRPEEQKRICGFSKHFEVENPVGATRQGFTASGVGKTAQHVTGSSGRVRLISVGVIYACRQVVDAVGRASIGATGTIGEGREHVVKK
jgi:hypothetical protein